MATNYTSTATRSGGWWAIEITGGLPGILLGISHQRIEQLADRTATRTP